MTNSELISRYWGTSWEMICELKEKFGGTLVSGLCMSKKMANRYGKDKDKLFVKMSMPCLTTVYMDKSGNIITSSTLSADELKLARETESVVPVKICKGDSKEVELTVVADDVADVVKAATVDISEAIKEFGWLYANISSSDKELSIDLMENGEDFEIETAMIVVRTYAVKIGAVNVLEGGLSKETVDNLLAIMNANYLRSLLN